jgi:cytochrome c oxidase cbb3-type subunit 2
VNSRLFFALGVLATLMASAFGLVVMPNWQFRGLRPVEDDRGIQHPTAAFGGALLGRQVYADLGCIYCHSQQVRAADFGADIDRGWGTRRSVARDYIFDNPPFMGTMRTGPDLENIGARQTSREWHALHLYNPQITSPGSIMPPHPFLFSRAKVDGPLARGAIRIPAKWAPVPSYIVPDERAEHLIEYLKSLDHTYAVPEAQ